MGDSLQIAPVNLAREATFALGRLEVRPATREVVGPDFRDVLEPRVMQVLVALARHPGAVVSRDDLTQACWEGRVVGEDAINRVISRLRRLAERDGGGSFSLETITKVGYRLVEAAPGPTAIAAALAAIPAAEPATPPAEADRPAQTFFLRRWLLSAIAALVLLAICAGVLLTTQDRSAPISGEVAADLEAAGEAMDRNTAEDTARSVVILEGVVAREPELALGWALLGLAYLQTVTYTRPDAQDAVETRAVAATKRALELDSEEPVARYVLLALGPVIGHWADREAAIRRELANTRQPLPFRNLLKGQLSDTGRAREAITLIEEDGAAESDTPARRAFYAAYIANLGRLVESERILDDAIERWPRNRSVFFHRFWLNVFTGRAKKALDMIEDPSARPTGIPREDFSLYAATARAFIARNPELVEEALRRSRGAARRGQGYAQNAMRVASALGELDMAFELANAIYLGRGIRIGGLMFSETQGQYATKRSHPVFLLYDISTSNMRHDMRFVGLAEELGLGAFWRETGNWPDFCADDAEAAEVCAALKRGG